MEVTRKPTRFSPTSVRCVESLPGAVRATSSDLDVKGCCCHGMQEIWGCRSSAGRSRGPCRVRSQCHSSLQLPNGATRLSDPSTSRYSTSMADVACFSSAGRVWRQYCFAHLAWELLQARSSRRAATPCIEISRDPTSAAGRKSASRTVTVGTSGQPLEDRQPGCK